MGDNREKVAGKRTITLYANNNTERKSY